MSEGHWPDDGYRYHSEMQARANFRLLEMRRSFRPLGVHLGARWAKPRRTGYFTSTVWKRDWRRHPVWSKSR